MEEYLFKDNFEYFMPPSVRDMTGDQVVWLRPKEYLFELALENENRFDMANQSTMPSYIKWLTSQFNFIKDRNVRDIDSREQIYKRIYPQKNGIPVIS